GCLRCHAPLGFLYQDVAGERAETNEGVSCDFCHRVAAVNERSTDLHVAELSTSDAIYGPTGGIDSPAHPTRRGAVFADSSLCALCHLDRSSDGIPLEHTFEEWKGSDFAKGGVGCADCHMPQKEGPATDVPGLTQRRSTHASHRFHGGHANSPMLQSAAPGRGHIGRCIQGASGQRPQPDGWTQLPLQRCSPRRTDAGD
ncbi:MAG: hypothetical protein ACE1Z4_09250, partial [Gammaproteobacteria bacterium]